MLPLRVEKVPIEGHPAYDNHQLLIEFTDKGTGLHGFIAIHNTNMGPAVGGTRMFPYISSALAVEDVLRLSRAMTYKCALAGVPYGGGKAVIIGNPDQLKNDAFLNAYASVVDGLKGQFFTGEDVGISEADVQKMLTRSNYFIGKKNFAGDPSPYAALSTFLAMKAAIKEVLHSDSLEGIKVAIKGVGKVGGELARLLCAAKCKVYISDINANTAQKIGLQNPSIQIVENDSIMSLDVDVYSPCAMGNEFNVSNIVNLKAKIICGAANNQLENLGVADELNSRGIVYVVDYIANAGGLINVVDELEPGGYNAERVQNRIKLVEGRVANLITESTKTGLSTQVIADRIAVKFFDSNR